MTLLLKYDNDAEWRTVQTLAAGEKRTVVVPLAVRRCDRWRLKLTGTGESRVYSIAALRYIGSERE